MHELTFVRKGQMEWRNRPTPTLLEPTDALVRPFIVGRCDGDTLPLHRNVSRPLQAAIKVGMVDPALASITGGIPFQGPFGIGHESIAQVIEIGVKTSGLAVGDVVVVPWAVACGSCYECQLGLTSKCSTTRQQSPGKTLAAFGLGVTSGPWGGMVADTLRIPHADFNLVRVPPGVPPLRVAAASDNLSDAWRAIVPPLSKRPGGKVLVIGGGCRSIGLYAAGLAVCHNASQVDYADHKEPRLAIAEELGARVLRVDKSRRNSQLHYLSDRYDVVVEASSTGQGLRDALRATRPGGIVTGTGYYLNSNTRLPVMDMYATSATLHVGISHVRPILPDLLGFVASTDFPAEKVTTLLADWDDAPNAYQARTTKLVLHRAPLEL
jgi:threonine dehydrogenase-like Zn-dependent dehydrogenase